MNTALQTLARIMTKVSTHKELCADLKQAPANMYRILSDLRTKYGVVYIRAWIPSDAPKAPWAALYDAQTTPFEHPDAPKPEPQFPRKKSWTIASDAACQATAQARASNRSPRDASV